MSPVGSLACRGLAPARSGVGPFGGGSGGGGGRIPPGAAAPTLAEAGGSRELAGVGWVGTAQRQRPIASLHATPKEHPPVCHFQKETLVTSKGDQATPVARQSHLGHASCCYITRVEGQRCPGYLMPGEQGGRGWARRLREGGCQKTRPPRAPSPSWLSDLAMGLRVHLLRNQPASGGWDFHSS